MVKRLPFLRLIIWIPVFLAGAMTARAQIYIVTGKVMEASEEEALPGASLSLYAAGDTVPFSGTVSGDSGRFMIAGVPPGDYWLEVAYIGFVSDTLALNHLNVNSDLGSVILRPSAVLLEDVAITDKAPGVEYDFEKKIYRMDNDLFSTSGSASDVLQNIPSVSVDVDGTISMRGTQNITVFINGKPSAMLRRNASLILGQLPANSIERIEIITNPSARYRPDGVGGIINIVLKEDKGDKLNGQVIANAGTEGRWNGNLNLNYGKEELNLFATYGIRHSDGVFLHTDDRVYKNEGDGSVSGSYEEDQRSRNNGLSHDIYAGANLEINDYNSVEISGSFFMANSLNTSFAEISNSDSLGQLSSVFTNDQDNDEYEAEGEANFAFEHVFKKNEDHTLSFEAAYSSFDEREDLTFNQSYSFPSIETQVRSNLIEKSGNQQEILLDYVLPLGEEGELENGYAGEFILEDIRLSLNQSPNRFLFRQQIHAGYATYSQAIEDFSFKAGLRAEQTMITSQLVEPVDSTNHNNYFKLFPTLYLGYELSEKKQISLSYSKRINRPDSDELNPNLEYSDPRNAESGNPSLRPEQVHSFELGFQSEGKKVTFTPTLYYRYTYDAFTFIQTNIADTVVLYKAVNLNTQQNAGLEAILSTKFFKQIKTDLTGNVYYNNINASSLGFSGTKSTISGTLKGSFQYKPKKGPSVQLNAFYYFPHISPQRTRLAYFYLNMGMKQDLLKKKLAFTLTGTDILHTYKVQSLVRSTALDQTTVFQRRMPVVFLGIVWQFSGAKGKDELMYEGG